MECTIEKAKMTDVIYIKNFLKNRPAIFTLSLTSDIVNHIEKENCVAMKLLDTNKNIVGVWLSKEFDTHVSLTFFCIDEKIRRSINVFSFFSTCYCLINKKKPLVLKTKDTTGFDKYIKKIDEDTYQFIGFKKWEV